MTTLTLNGINKKKLSALKAFLKALDVNYKFDNALAETMYLNSNEANRNALNESIKQAENGQYKKINITELWK